MTDGFDRLKAALADRYAIERELGSGGMATVYLAEDLKLHRKVALKVLRPELASALGPDRFLQEIDIGAKLAHPHILPLHDCGEADGFLYFVMPYVEGQSLRNKLAKEGELPIAEAVRVLRDVVDALSHAHKHNVVHRDIKPDNVMLSEGHALVTDFGVAKAVSDATGAIGLTTEGVALGTPAYMSPEQTAADPHIDHRADIYAVGVIAYELLTGRTPFVGNTQQELMVAHVTQSPEPVTKYRESVPPALGEFVMRCLEKKAADRWQTAEELLLRLEELATPSSGVTPTRMMPVPSARGGWKLVATLGAVAAILAVVLVVAWLPRVGATSLNPNLVAVAVFRNATGDPSLDQVGERAAHWITQGLQQAAIQVTPWDGAFQAWRYVQSKVDAGGVREPMRVFAEETGAGTVVSGVVYLENDSLEIHVDATDALLDQPLGTVDPVRGPRESTREVIDDMQQQVMGFLAMVLDERIAAQATSVVLPPSFEAYSAFDDGMTHYLRKAYRQAIPYFYRAFELDTTFVAPLLYATLCNNNIAQWAQSDSLVGILEHYRERLTDYDRHWLDYLGARVGGHVAAALRAIRRAADLSPGSKAVYNRAFSALRNNRPQEAVDALLTLDPQRGPMRGWAPYFTHLVWAYLDLGEYESALNAARQGHEMYGDRLESMGLVGVALAAVGRFDDLGVLVDELAGTPPQGLSQGIWLRNIAVYGRRRGTLAAARSAINRSIQWFDERPQDIKQIEGWRYSYSWALFAADRCEEAYGVALHLSEEFPHVFPYRAAVGVFAACRGDREEALQISQWLGALELPYLRGNNTMFQALIAGALSDAETTVALWRKAFSEGFSFPYPWEFGWPAIEPVRNDPTLREWLRPKG